MILVVGFLSMSGTISLICFKIPSSAKSTPDIEKRNDFHLQFVVVAVEVVVVMVMVMVVVVVVAMAFYY